MTCELTVSMNRTDGRTHKEAMMKAHSAFGGGNGDVQVVDEDGSDADVTPIQAQAGPSRLPISTFRPNTETGLPDGPALTDASTTLLARAGVIEEEDLDSDTRKWMEEAGLMPESFESTYGLLPPEDAVIIRPYGGEDDDILLQELRPRFVIMYEPNLAFIRRLEVCHCTHRYRRC
jgi:DNA excision repair protein ERCC-4